LESEEAGVRVERIGGLLRALGNLARGVAIGVAEIIPGVSGGTVALIVGVYQSLIGAASHVVRSFTLALSATGRRRISSEVAHIRFVIVVPVLVGMVAGIFVGAALLEPVIVAHPVETRAVFAGLILASLWVPITMVGSGWNLRMMALAALGATASFLFTGLPVLADASDSLWWVAPAAAVAVCALVLPGVSGSFLLVTLGMYEPTLAAVNDRDFGYLGVFVLGAIVGLAAFVGVLQWLLEHRRVLTLVVMTGLMAGSLRALWPWQGEDRELLAMPEGGLAVWGWSVVAGLVVVVVIALERFLQARVNPQQ
jgi:putative membrane protein